jgi:hypothetical protein
MNRICTKKWGVLILQAAQPRLNAIRAGCKYPDRPFLSMLYQNRRMINGLFLITGRHKTLSNSIFYLIRTQKSEFLSLSRRLAVWDCQGTNCLPMIVAILAREFVATFRYINNKDNYFLSASQRFSMTADEWLHAIQVWEPMRRKNFLFG